VSAPGIVLYPDPRLGQRAVPRAVDSSLLAIGDRLQRAAEAAQAFGLAAVHIGAVAPVVVISVATDPAVREYRVLYNPEVTALANDTTGGIEGSVSLPGIEVEVVRPVWAALAFDDADGNRQALRLEGLPARIAQHEIDQMNGVFFLERVSRLKRDMALKKWKKRAG
jgi:peptide deformylase